MLCLTYASWFDAVNRLFRDQINHRKNSMNCSDKGHRYRTGCDTFIHWTMMNQNYAALRFNSILIDVIVWNCPDLKINDESHFVFLFHFFSKFRSFVCVHNVYIRSWYLTQSLMQHNQCIGQQMACHIEWFNKMDLDSKSDRNFHLSNVQTKICRLENDVDALCHS